jgi:hypothetical protein
VINLVVRHFINRKIGLSTDPKPLPQYLRINLFHEQDTGDLYLSDGDTTTLTQGKTLNQAYQNKSINVEQNTILNLIEDNPFSQNTMKRKGGIIPATTVANSFYGILEDNGVVLYNADKIKVDNTTNQLMVSFQGSVANDKVGFATALPIARRDENYEIKLQFKSRSSLRTLIGFSATQNYPDTVNNVFGTGQIGACFGFTSASSNFSIYTNDGNGANQAIPIPFSVPKDQNLHTLEFKLLSTKIVCTLDNETIETTTRLPPLTTALYLVAYGVI